MAGLATPVVPLASLALLATIAVHPEPTADRDPRTSPVADSYDGFDTKAAEQLRLDQCLMADGLRRGGPNLYSLANTSLPLLKRTNCIKRQTAPTAPARSLRHGRRTVTTPTPG
ncbi:hypothetical protein HEP87_56740 [Streptomyces sp. S1D4-11]